MKQYKFLVTETLQNVLTIEANSKKAAIKEANRRYSNEQGDNEGWALNYSDCVGESIKLITEKTKMFPLTRRRNNL